MAKPRALTSIVPLVATIRLPATDNASLCCAVVPLIVCVSVPPAPTSTSPVTVSLSIPANGMSTVSVAAPSTPTTDRPAIVVPAVKRGTPVAEPSITITSVAPGTLAGDQLPGEVQEVSVPIHNLPSSKFQFTFPVLSVESTA